MNYKKPMEFTHNNIIDKKTRNNEESYNQKFIESLGLNLNVDQYEKFSTDELENDSTCYMTVWLQNIDRLMKLVPEKINLVDYTLTDVGCGLGISTLYFLAK